MKNKSERLKQQIIVYTKEVCKSLGTEPVEIVFVTHHHGIACVVYRDNIVKRIEVDINKVGDAEATILHELAHVLLIRQRGMAKHTAKFSRLYCDLCQKFMYSELSFKIFNSEANYELQKQ